MQSPTLRDFPLSTSHLYQCKWSTNINTNLDPLKIHSKPHPANNNLRTGEENPATVLLVSNAMVGGDQLCHPIPSRASPQRL